jgi:hypothetical protein
MFVIHGGGDRFDHEEGCWLSIGGVVGGSPVWACTGTRDLRGRLGAGLVDFVRRGAVAGGVATAFGGEVDGSAEVGIGVAEEV